MKQKKFFYIIRHGETIWSRIQLLQGRQDIPLSDYGLQQSRDMARFFSEHALSYVGASPLVRTQQTAKTIAGMLEIPKITSQGLIARDYGIWEGKNIDSIKKENRALCNQLKYWTLDQIFSKAPLTSIESYQTVSERALTALKEFSELQGNALLVTHTGVITSILLALKFPTFELPLLSHQGYVKLSCTDEGFALEEVQGLISPPKARKQKENQRTFIF